MITKDKTDYLRGYDVICDKGARIGKYSFKVGATPVVHEKVNYVVQNILLNEMKNAIFTQKFIIVWWKKTIFT